MVSTSNLLTAKNRTDTTHITKLSGLLLISRILNKHQTLGGHRMNAELPREWDVGEDWPVTQQTTRDGSQPEGQTITCEQMVNSRTTGSWLLFSVDSRRDTGKDEGEKEDQPEPTAHTSLLTPLSDPQQPGAAFLLARRLWLPTCYTVGRGWGCLCICVPICPNLDLLLASCSDCRGLCVCVSVCVWVCVCVCLCLCVCSVMFSSFRPHRL